MISSEPDNAGVVAPPPLIYLAGAAVGWGIQHWIPWALFPLRLWWLGVPLIVLGAGLALWAVSLMRSAGTNIDPGKPVTHLVRAGPFRCSRNPIYLSLTALLVGAALIANSGWMLVMVVPILVLMHYGVVRREERYLEAKFQDEYRAYIAHVRRWL